MLTPKSVQPLRYWCHKVLPLVYDDALSYYEVLCKVSQKLNEVIEAQEGFADGLEQSLQAQIDALARQWDAQIRKLITDFQTQVTGQINANQAWVEQQVATMRVYVENQLKVLFRLIADAEKNLKIWVAVELKKIAEEISKITSVSVVSPVDHEIKPIQIVLDEMWYYLRYLAITAIQYDMLKLTAEEYDALEITAFEFDLYAKWLLKIKPKLEPPKMFSEFTGLKSTYPQVISEIISVLRVDGITAEYFGNGNNDAETLDGYRRSSFDWDWKAAQFFVYS